jgi:hypothetical protein
MNDPIFQNPGSRRLCAKKATKDLPNPVGPLIPLRGIQCFVCPRYIVAFSIRSCRSASLKT